MLENEPRAQTLEAPSLDPATMTTDAITDVAQRIHDTQVAHMTSDDKAKRFLRLRSKDDWEKKIRAGEVQYVADESGIEFCGFCEHLGELSIADFSNGEDQPAWLEALIDKGIANVQIYKTGGLMVRHPSTIQKYSETFKVKGHPEALIVTRTHGGIGRFLKGLGYLQLSHADFNSKFPALAELYVQSGALPDLPGANFFIRPPLSKT